MSFPHHRQSGGTFMGMVLGLVLGLGVALVVALYVTKAPVPFVDRGILAAPQDEAAQDKKNQGWNPNAGFNQNQAPSPASPDQAQVPAPQTEGTDQAAAPATTDGVAPQTPPAAANDPLGEMIQRQAQSNDEAATTTPVLPVPASREAGQVRELVFYVQAGAFGQVGDAENQRARLALMGVDTRVSQDVVNERTVYRVRSGPYRTRSLALKTRQKLTDQNVESVVVAVPK